MRGGASVKARLEALERRIGERDSPEFLMFDGVPEGCPTPRFDEALRVIEKKWPGTPIAIIRLFSDDKPPPEPSTLQKPWTATVTAAYEALAADVAEWRTTAEYRELLAAEVRADIRHALGANAGGMHAIERLRRDRERCERYGVPFPPEAQAIIDGTHALEGPAAAQVLELPAWWSVDDGSTKLVPTKPAPVPQLGPQCGACRCSVDKHEAWTERRRCIWCESSPQDHQSGWAGACGTYQSYRVVNADGCVCRRCPGLRIQPPTRVEPAQEAAP